MGSFGATEMIVVLIIVLLLFGANKIPQLATGLGEGIRNFKRGLRDQDGDPKGQTPGNSDDKIS